MKSQTSEAHNVQVIRFAGVLVSLPSLAVRAVYRWVRGRLRSGMSAGALRGEDQLRQSRARRTLRGLPPDHDPAAAAAAAASRVVS